MDPTTLTTATNYISIILALCFVVSETLAVLPKNVVQANSLLQLIVNIFKALANLAVTEKVVNPNALSTEPPQPPPTSTTVIEDYKPISTTLLETKPTTSVRV
jgi:predicted transcriptional regulator